MNDRSNTNYYDVEVFYDGDCPLCLREINMLKRWDRTGKILFTNIADPEFQAESIGTTYEALMDRIHGRLSNGQIIQGVEVFRRLYSAIGFGPLVMLTRLPVVSQLMDFGYAVFAKNRLRFTGRCDARSCRVPEFEARPSKELNVAVKSDP